MSRKVKKTVRKVRKVVKSVAKNPIVGELTKQAQMSLASSGPLGSAAAGVLGGMAAVVKGKNLEDIGWSAVEGASPQGIRQAIQAAHKVRDGEPVMSAAVGALASSLEPEGAKVVGRVVSLVKSGATIAHLATARRSLGKEEHRRVFDATVGTISRAAKKTKGKSVPTTQKVVAARQAIKGLSRPMTVRDPIAERHSRASTARRSSVDPLDRRLAEHPEWAALRPAALASRLGTDQRSALGALDRRVRSWRPVRLSRRALSLLARLAPAVPIGVFSSDAAGFEQASGKWVYVVEKGDYPYALASQYAPGGKAKAGSTYRALLKANPQYKLNAKKDNFAQFYAGMRLNWPDGWQTPAAAEPAPTVAPAPTPSAAPTPTPSTPAVMPDATASLTAVVQAKAMLAAWGVSDGTEEPGLTDYGKTPEDLSATWTSRDRLMLQAFSRWSNGRRNTNLATDGVLSQDHIRELQRWAEQKAQAPAVPATGNAPTLPSLPSASGETLPTIKLPPVVVAPAPKQTKPKAKKTTTTTTANKAAAPATAKKSSSVLPILAAAAAFAML